MCLCLVRVRPPRTVPRHDPRQGRTSPRLPNVNCTVVSEDLPFGLGRGGEEVRTSGQFSEVREKTMEKGVVTNGTVVGVDRAEGLVFDITLRVRPNKTRRPSVCYPPCDRVSTPKSWTGAPTGRSFPSLVPDPPFHSFPSRFSLPSPPLSLQDLEGMVVETLFGRPTLTCHLPRYRLMCRRGFPSQTGRGSDADAEVTRVGRRSHFCATGLGVYWVSKVPLVYTTSAVSTISIFSGIS